MWRKWVAAAAAGTVLACVLQPVRAAQLHAVLAGGAHEGLFSIAMLRDHGVAVGAVGELLETSDGGASWKSPAPDLTPLALLGVDLAPGHRVAVGQRGLVLVRDGAGTWNEADSGTDARLFAVSVNRRGRAVAVGAFGTVLGSEDGGLHWHSVAPNWFDYALEGGAEPHLYDVDVDDAGVVTVVGEFGLILRSHDAGTSWHTVHQGDASLFALDLREDGVGYAVGQSGMVLRTDDAGAHWRAVAVGSDAILLGVSSTRDGRVVITGMREMLASRDGGNSWNRVQGDDVNLSWYVGAASTDGGVLVVGHGGRIARVAD